MRDAAGLSLGSATRGILVRIERFSVVEDGNRLTIFFRDGLDNAGCPAPGPDSPYEVDIEEGRAADVYRHLAEKSWVGKLELSILGSLLLGRLLRQ